MFENTIFCIAVVELACRYCENIFNVSIKFSGAWEAVRLQVRLRPQAVDRIFCSGAQPAGCRGRGKIFRT